MTEGGMQLLDRLLFLAKAQAAEVLVACEEERSELDNEEHEVLFDELDAADEHLTIALSALHPEWKELDEKGFERALDEGYQRAGPVQTPVPVHGERQLVIELLARVSETIVEALESVEQVGLTATGDAPCDTEEALEELECATGHIECVLFLLDPDRFSPPPHDATAEERVWHASQMELLELHLEESRAFARSRLAWFAAGRKWLAFRERYPDAAERVMAELERLSGKPLGELVALLRREVGMDEEEALIFLNQQRE